MKIEGPLIHTVAAGLLALAGIWFTRMSAADSPARAARPAHPAPVATFEKTQTVVFNKLDFVINQIYERLGPSEPWPEFNRLIREAARETRTMPNIAVPMRIFPDVYIVAGSDSYQRVYVVDCGEDFLLIDTGDNRTRDEQMASLRHLGFRTQVPKWVFVTHCHYDHALNSRFFQEMGSEIMIHAADAPALATVNERTLMFNVKGAEFPPCKADRLLDDGDVLRLGNKTFHVYHTPGHTHGSACLMLQHDGKNLLFTGDTAMFNGRMGVMNYPYNSFRQYLDSADKLLRLRVQGRLTAVDALLPGHGTLVLAGGTEHLRRLQRNVRWVLEQREAGVDVDSVDPWERVWLARREAPGRQN